MKISHLHIIEPTLFDQTGHGYSYVKSMLLANANFDFDINVWLDRRGRQLLSPTLCKTHAYFWRPLRQLQKLALYWRLIQTEQIIFVSTSDLWDMKILALYKRILKSTAQIFLHFHQFNQKPNKLRQLQTIALSCPDLHIMTPTAKLSAVFSKSGFQNCITIPCPTFAPVVRDANPLPDFKKLLYAGAARSDKGFPIVVELLSHMRNADINIPFEIQVSAPNSQRYDHKTSKALEQLMTLPKQNLILHNQTLTQDQYLDLFKNAICLLLYDKNGYSDKFSGIALDAFYAGCPIITVKDTWMGDTAEKYSAGIALPDYALTTIQGAIAKIMANYSLYCANAKQAATELTKLHDPNNTLRYISQQSR